MYHLKQQYAMIELQSRVIVQSIDENTLVVKVHFVLLPLSCSSDLISIQIFIPWHPVD